MQLEKILPANGPSIDEVQKYIYKYSEDIIVIKCGGSVLLDNSLFNQFIEDMCVINKLGLSAVVIHGGGKNIKKKLDEKNIESNFIDGLRDKCLGKLRDSPMRDKETEDETIKLLQKKLNDLSDDELEDTYWEIETGEFFS